jgi:Predicted membrane protein
MESRVKLFGHSVHPMLVVFPLGVLGTSVVFDLIHLASGASYAAPVASALITSGLVGGLLATPFGTIDCLAIPKRARAQSIGALHGRGNVVAEPLERSAQARSA